MAKKKYSCDFETITDPLDCRIWIWGSCVIGDDDNIVYGNSMEGYIDWCEKTVSTAYFHNLRFDGEFIVNHLLHLGWKNDGSKEGNTFDGLVSGFGQWYSLTLYFEGKNGKIKKMTLLDSLKKLPMPVSAIAKAYGMDVQKGDLDYHSYRAVGHEATEEELAYFFPDLKIVAKGLELQFEQGLTKMTNGSDALSDFKATIGESQFKNYFPVLKLDVDTVLRKAYKGGFTWLNPKYAGKGLGEGMVFDVNSLYPSQMLNRELPVGIPIPFSGEYVEDSSHPLYIQHIFVSFRLKKDKIPTIQIKGSKRFGDNEYLTSSDGLMVDLYLTNIDLGLFFDHYEVDEIEYVDGFKFQSRKGIFDSFIYKWTIVKTQNEGGIRLLAKLMLNSLYGKFATNPDITGKEAYLKADGSTGWRNKNGVMEWDEKSGMEKWVLKEDLKEYRDPVYTPMGAFITSWARYTTITSAQKVYPDRLVYCDTDSIHMLGLDVPEEMVDIIHDTRIGYWQHESTFKRARYLRQKTYIDDNYGKWVEKDGEQVFKEVTDKNEATGSKTSVKCSGMPDNLKKYVTWDNFRIGLTFVPDEVRSDVRNVRYGDDGRTVYGIGRLMPNRVKGGVVLDEKDFAIKAYVPKGEQILREMEKVRAFENVEMDG